MSIYLVLSLINLEWNCTMSIYARCRTCDTRHHHHFRVIFLSTKKQSDINTLPRGIICRVLRRSPIEEYGLSLLMRQDSFVFSFNNYYCEYTSQFNVLYPLTRNETRTTTDIMYTQSVSGDSHITTR